MTDMTTTDNVLTASTYEADRDALYDELIQDVPLGEDPDVSEIGAAQDALNDALSNTWFEGITYSDWRAEVRRRLASVLGK
jgi:hypothetical protein